MEIIVQADICQKVDVSVNIDEIIDRINDLNITGRWNYIAKILNGITVNEIEFLKPKDKKVILDYLKRKVKLLEIK